MNTKIPMRNDETYTMEPAYLHVSEQLLSRMGGSEYGDVVTFGSEQCPAINTDGFQIPPNQKFILTRPNA